MLTMEQIKEIAELNGIGIIGTAATTTVVTVTLEIITVEILTKLTFQMVALIPKNQKF